MLVKIKQAILHFITKETVVFISFILAFLSIFIVTPDKEYLSYIDFRTLAILLCLMFVMSGLRALGVFEKIGVFMLEKTSSIKSLSFVLILLCFFFSMLITNDVALITFVPFTIEVLVMAELEQYLITIIVFQTIAANLGSMLTPIGNPQNLYLYTLSAMPIDKFILLMLPYTILSLILLIICTVIKIGKEPTTAKLKKEIHFDKKQVKTILLYLVLFFLALSTVIRITPYYITLIITILCVLLFDRANIKRPDYFLLLTFIFLFIFIGNLGRIDFVSKWLSNIVNGQEVVTAIVASQFTSNVPAAVLLSGFSTHYDKLVIGTNLGGLGTLIASMASLISYKFFAKKCSDKRLKYIGIFTIYNLIFLAILFAFSFLI